MNEDTAASNEGGAAQGEHLPRIEDRLDLDRRNRLLALFAEIMDYPTGSLSASAGKCATLLNECCPGAEMGIQAFGAFAEGEGTSRMEEIYTRAFDITPTTTLYVGYHLFGESYKRGAFLVRLQQAYREHGFSAGPELADHLSVLLRFASIADEPEFVDPLFEECILPVLAKMEEAFDGGENVYRLAIGALRSLLGTFFDPRPSTLATPHHQPGGLNDD